MASIIPRSQLPRGVIRRKSGYKQQDWHRADFDSPVEVLLWRLGDDEPLPYGDTYMLKLSSIVGTKKAAGVPAATDPAAAKLYPAITLLLTATVDDEGKPRKTATLTIVAEDGLFKGGLRDRDANASVWRSAKTLNGLLEALESALASGEADWRVSEPASGSKGR